MPLYGRNSIFILDKFVKVYNIDMNEFMSEKEFNNLRDKIVEIFSNKSFSPYYNIKKSTYKWSSKYNFRINIECTSKSRISYTTTPHERIGMLKDLMDTAMEFVQASKEELHFIGFTNTSGEFNFIFSFQPTALLAKTLLEK